MKYIKHNKRVLIVLAYFIFYLLMFYFLENRKVVHISILNSALEIKIPFCEYFIVPYFLWFFYIAAAVIFFTVFNESKMEFQQLAATLGIGMTLFLIISFIFPNGQNLRPAVFTRDNIFVDMVRQLYRTDTPTNIFPSIHVFNSVAVHIAIARSETLKKHNIIVNSSFILALLITLSTVFLKQHALIDVVGAGVLNLICYIMIYKPSQAMERAVNYR